jgi:hypothetical protein
MFGRTPKPSLIIRTALGVALAAAALSEGPAASASAQAASACTVAYSVTSSWQGGFQGGITITNEGQAIASWTLAFTFPDNDQTITGGWGGAYAQNGRAISVTSESYDGALATGANTTIGFIANVGPANGTPGYFSVNGYACNGATQVPSVQITSPADYADYTPGQSITIDAPATEPTATISAVEFFANGTPIGTVTASPYDFTWADVPAGYYTLTAEAFDSNGVSSRGGQRGADDKHSAAVAGLRQQARRRQRQPGHTARCGPVRHRIRLCPGLRHLRRPGRPGLNHCHEAVGYQRGPGAAERSLLER